MTYSTILALAGILLAGLAGGWIGWLLHKRGEISRRRAAEATSTEFIKAAGRARDRARAETRAVETRQARLVAEHERCADEIARLRGTILELEMRDGDADDSAETGSGNSHPQPIPIGGHPAPPPSRRDDLQAIRGIGPALERELNRLGFYSYEQLAGLTADEIEWLGAQIQTFPHRITRDRWVDQARRLQSAASRGADTA